MDDRSGTKARNTLLVAVGRGDRFLEVVVRRLIERGRLTPRTAEAVRYHVYGWPPSAAATQMCCSLNTYRNHLSAALLRVGAESRSELFRVVANDLDARPRAFEFEPAERAYDLATTAADAGTGSQVRSSGDRVACADVKTVSNRC